MVLLAVIPNDLVERNGLKEQWPNAQIFGHEFNEIVGAKRLFLTD